MNSYKYATFVVCILFAAACENKLKEIYVKASLDKAVDTTGAGDAFNGGFSFALLKGKKIKECLEMANKVAGFSTTRLGAGDSMPTLKDINLKV